MEFAELAAKTNYSFLEGASHPEEMVSQAHALGYHSLGVSDVNGVYGIPRLHSTAKSFSLPLLVGAEINLPHHLPVKLLAQNRNGYGNLCELLTQVHSMEALAKGVSWEWLATKHQDLFLLLPANSASIETLAQAKLIFGSRLYLLASRFLDGKDAESLQVAEQLSKQHNLPVVASNQPLFHVPQRKPLQDVLTCIRHGCSLQEGGFRLLPNDERHLKSKLEMAKLFKGYETWIENTVKVAEQCRFSLDEIKYHYPTEWIPEGETGDSYLEKLVWESIPQRYPTGLPEKVKTLLQHELNLIRQLQYSDYFLTIWDIVHFARKRDILCQGRGSAANSAVCFVLGITAIDPMKTDLLFERFLSMERKEPPDIDIDFEHERREEVIQYLYRRYGRARAAITAEVICYRRKSALREVAKTFSLSTASVERILTLTHKKKLSECKMEELCLSLPELPLQQAALYFKLAQSLLGFPRHLGTHVGGFVLSQEVLCRLVPIEPAAMENRTIIQWDKNDLDTLGFIKVDILGLGILTSIRKSFTYLKDHHGQIMDLSTIPSEDPAVYDQICQADTVGVFQIESRAQMSMLPRLQPRNFFDLVAEISIVRPGPIQGGMVHPYLRRRQGLEKIEYPHPDLKEILEKTYGVPLFQEQIMKIAMKVAGFNPGEADELRRSMGTWQKTGDARLIKMGEKFRQGLMQRGISQEFAERTVKQVQGFAEYGFPESHAASFAILAYATAYLKRYYPDVFVTALLNSQPMGFYSAQTLIYDAIRHGVKMLGISVGDSLWDCRLEGPGQVRLGFREIKGLPKRVGLALETIRSEKKLSLEALILQLQNALAPFPLTKKDLFLLAGANALESLGLSRREAFWKIQALSLRDSRYFSPEEESSPLPPETEWEKTALDYETQGVSLYAHPMKLLRKDLFNQGVSSSSAVAKLKTGHRVKVAGIVISRQMPPTASGVLFISLEDEYGFMNLVIWKKTFEAYRDCLLTQSFLLCEGKIETSGTGSVVNIIVEKVKSLLQPETVSPSISSHDFH